MIVPCTYRHALTNNCRGIEDFSRDSHRCPGCPTNSIPHMIHGNAIKFQTKRPILARFRRHHEPSTEVYAVHGADPEVLAYGMAKYSRSALSMRESLAELNEQKAEKFLNTFYFQYGHRSIADLAHVAFAIERLSILAATVAVDEPRWDGQERSTRYQDFQKSGYFVPDFGDDSGARALYRETVDLLFAEYRHFSNEMFRYLRDRTPKPDEMKLGGLRTHSARPRLRHFAIPAAAGHEYFAGPDRQRPHLGDASIALVGGPACGSAPDRRVTEAGGARGRLQRKSRGCSEPAGRHSKGVRGACRSCPAGTFA